MNVFELYSLNGYECFGAKEDTIPANIANPVTGDVECKGQPLADSWSPIHIEVMRGRGYENNPPGDFPIIFTGMYCNCLSERAVRALEDIWLENGELLPLSCNEGIYFAYNVTRIVDALDEERSEDPTSGSVSRHVFFPELVSGLTLFKIPQTALIRTYVTDTFVERIRSTDLKGFGFRHLWSDSELASTD